MSPGRFGGILRNQLKVSRGEFWNALQTGQPVDRPSEEEPEPVVAHEGYVVTHLLNFGVSQQEIEVLSVDEALALLHSKWSGQ
jgi:hypothetical protein